MELQRKSHVNRWLIGHGNPFRSVAGAPHLPEGEAAVIRPGLDGRGPANAHGLGAAEIGVRIGHDQEQPGYLQ
jgi:hypothetical protein